MYMYTLNILTIKSWMRFQHDKFARSDSVLWLDSTRPLSEVLLAWRCRINHSTEEQAPVLD